MYFLFQIYVLNGWFSICNPKILKCILLQEDFQALKPNVNLSDEDSDIEDYDEQ